MGNTLIPLNRAAHNDRTKYSSILKDEAKQQWLEQESNSQIDSIWRDVTHQNIYYRAEYGKFQVYRNDFTLQEVEKYKIILKDKSEFEKWKELVKWRNNCQYLCKVEHFIIENLSQICVSQFEVNVIVQRIPLRLADLTDIPFPQNLYFLLAVLKGLKYIYTYPFGLKTFNIKQSMICVNRQGEVKVWLNPNLSQFEPINEKQNNQISQQNLINTVLDLIEQNTDQRDYPYPFKKYLNERPNQMLGDFNWVIQQLYLYASQMVITVPRFTFSVRDILNRELLNGMQKFTDNSLQINKIQLTEQQSKDNLPAEYQKVLLQKDLIHNDPSLKSLQFQNQSKRHQNFHNQISNNILFQQHLNGNSALPITPNPNQGLKNHHMNIQPRTSWHAINNIKQNNNFYSTNQINSSNAQTDMRVSAPISHQYSNNIVQFQNIQNPKISFIASPYEFRNNQIQINEQRRQNQPRDISMKRLIQFPFKSTSYFENPHLSFPKSQNEYMNNHDFRGYKENQRFFYNNPYCNDLSQREIRLAQINMQQTQKNHYVYKNLPKIQRVNSCNIELSSFPLKRLADPQKLNYRLIYTNSQPIRPESLSNQIKVERISRYTPSNQSRQINYSSSFKNKLVKMQKQEQFRQSQQMIMRYFTKKDSQQTLDPEIAVDLIKYLN